MGKHKRELHLFFKMKIKMITLNNSPIPLSCGMGTEPFPLVTLHPCLPVLDGTERAVHFLQRVGS